MTAPAVRLDAEGLHGTSPAAVERDYRRVHVDLLARIRVFLEDRADGRERLALLAALDEAGL